MGRKFDWKTWTFKDEPEASFSSFPVPIPDGVPLPANDPRIALMFTPGGVTREAAMQIPAVARGINSLAKVATLPLVCLTNEDQNLLPPNTPVRNELLRKIDPDLIDLVTKTRTIYDFVFDGVAYWQILTINKSTKYPTKARHIPSGRVTEQNGEIWIDGEQVDPDEVIVFRSPRPALLPMISQTVRQAIALARTSEMFARNPMPKLIFSPREGIDPDQDATRQAIQSFADTASEFPYNYVGAALDAKPIELLSPVELQLIEQDKALMLKIANFFDMSPEEVGISVNSLVYKNAVERRIDQKIEQLTWIALTIEQTLTDVTPRGYSVRFNFDEFFRADPETRAQVAQIDIEMGAGTVDEYRATKDLPPLTPEQKNEISARLPAQNPSGTQASFSADDDAAFSFDSAEFSDVDENSRTVKVLAVPYGEVSSIKSGRKFVFTPGSVNYPENLKKIKLLRDHDYTQSVGHAIAVEDTPKGLEVTFKVAPGVEGDRALAGFTDGNYDAASVGVDFDENGVYSERGKPGIYYVRSARLKEVSQVAIPAFENAGLISVQASGEENNMSEITGANDNAPDINKLVADAVAAAFAAKNVNPFPATKETAPSIQADENVAPRELKANGQDKAVTFVNEPGPYRFDGNEGNYEFSGDLMAMQRGDGTARGRVLEFINEEFAVTTSNVSTLNTSVQQPARYVDQLDYALPIWTNINKGAPPNGVTPFTWPKFNSATGLVSDHVEMAEPTPGTFTATNQTVTPTALSGKVEISREVWDQGGNPALSSLIRDEMRRAYYEGLETAAAKFLDDAAGAITTVTITAGTSDSALEEAILDIILGLQANRGGFRQDVFALHADLYAKLIKAKDSTGRRLYPAIGPNNANGTVARRFASLDINGLQGFYSRVMGATTNVGRSYLFNGDDVEGWATAPQNLTFEYQVAHIDLAIWGYKAFALRRADQIRRIAYNKTGA